jgi:uncharacterized membrane protein
MSVTREEKKKEMEKEISERELLPVKDTAIRLSFHEYYNNYNVTFLSTNFFLVALMLFFFEFVAGYAGRFVYSHRDTRSSK